MDFHTASNALTHLLELTREASREEGARHHPLIFKDDPTRNGLSNVAHFQPTDKFWLKVRLLIPFLPHLPGSMHDGPTYFISDILHHQTSGSKQKALTVPIDPKSDIGIKEQIVSKMQAAFLELDQIRRDIEEPFV